MPFKTHNKRSLYLLLGALGLAAFGQYFLAQRENPHTLIPGLLFYALAVGFFLWATPKPAPFGTPDPGLGFRWEVAGFISIMALALFLRVYRLDQFPAGIYYDESCLGWGGLTILREGWRPFYEIYHLSNGNISLYYPMALWFKYISPTQVHFFLFSVFLTLAAFPLAYWTFRQLAGSRVALLALFIMAVMRWNITFSRNNHPAFEILFYILGALAFFLYGLRTGKSWAYSVGT